MVTNVTSLLKTVKAVEDEATRGTRALEATIEFIKQELTVSLADRPSLFFMVCWELNIEKQPLCKAGSGISVSIILNNTGKLFVLFFLLLSVQLCSFSSLSPCRFSHSSYQGLANGHSQSEKWRSFKSLFFCNLLLILIREHFNSRESCCDLEFMPNPLKFLLLCYLYFSSSIYLCTLCLFPLQSHILQHIYDSLLHFRCSSPRTSRTSPLHLRSSSATRRASL